MALSVNAIIMKTNRLQETCDFYQTIGILLEKEQHDDGPIHYTCDLNGIHFGIYELDPWKKEERRSDSHGTMIGFDVENLDETMRLLETLGVQIIIPLEQVPWGTRAVVLDPDGRPIELNQKPSA